MENYRGCKSCPTIIIAWFENLEYEFIDRGKLLLQITPITYIIICFLFYLIVSIIPVRNVFSFAEFDNTAFHFF